VWTLGKMAILHQSVQQKAQDEEFNALATKLSYYYQMDTIYVRNDDNDIVNILHVFCKKINWSANDIQILSVSNANYLTITQSLSNQYFSPLALDQIFRQSDLDYLQKHWLCRRIFV
jgi:hypothetical protein